MKVRLEVAHSKANVKRVVLTRDAVIGRSAECNLRIAAGQVSRKHCTMLVSERGVYVRDLGSSNGTYIGERRLEANVDVPVPPGSELSIGGVRFRVRYELADDDLAVPTGSTVHHRRHDTLDPRRSSAEVDMIPEADVVGDTLDDVSADEPPAPSAVGLDVPIHRGGANAATAASNTDSTRSGETLSFGDDDVDEIETIPAFAFDDEDDSAVAVDSTVGVDRRGENDTDPGAFDAEETQSLSLGRVDDEEAGMSGTGMLSDDEIGPADGGLDEDDVLFDFLDDEADPADDEAVPEFLRHLDN